MIIKPSQSMLITTYYQHQLTLSSKRNSNKCPYHSVSKCMHFCVHAPIYTTYTFKLFNPSKHTNKFFGPSDIHCRQTASISEMNLLKNMKLGIRDLNCTIQNVQKAEFNCKIPFP